MPALDRERARELLQRVVTKYYGERHSPLPGAFVKAQMLEEAKQGGADFSERELGFRRFIEFVRTVPEVAIQGRSGSDFLLAPAAATDLLAAYASPLPRLRRDFWRAFIEFPVPNTVRFYDKTEDKIFYEEARTQRRGIEVNPVSRDTQLQWRRTFSDEQPVALQKDLLAALEGDGATVFNEFSRRLRENPPVMRAWNRYLQKQIVDHVSAWAAANNIPNERWLAPARQIELFYPPGEATVSRTPSLSQRAELYNLFDQLPIEDLLELRIPLAWVLKMTGRGNS
jgi:hypothetical protein